MPIVKLPVVLGGSSDFFFCRYLCLRLEMAWGLGLGAL